MVTGERKIDIALWIIFIQSHNVQHLILLWDRNILFQYCTYWITISISRYRHLFLIICAAFILSYTCGSNRLWNQLVLHCFMITSWDKNYNHFNLTINIPSIVPRIQLLFKIDFSATYQEMNFFSNFRYYFFIEFWLPHRDA